MADEPNEDLCSACQSPIIESASNWHGLPFCDSCVAILKKQEAIEKEQSPMCAQCAKTIQPLSAVRVNKGTILCSQCVADMDTATGPPDARNGHLAAIRQNLSAIRTDTQRIASVLTIWLILMIIVGMVVTVILFYAAFNGTFIWLKIAA